MEVIREGDGNRVACPCCRSILKFGPEDVSIKSLGMRDEGGNEIFSYSVACPVCRHSSINLVGVISSEMRSRAHKKAKENELFSSHDL